VNIGGAGSFVFRKFRLHFSRDVGILDWLIAFHIVRERTSHRQRERTGSNKGRQIQASHGLQAPEEGDEGQFEKVRILW
jgi:hypothetical protein